MKIVHTNAMVCHLWANQSQPEARNSNGSLFFEGPNLYSYRRGYKIAQIIEGTDGQTYYFINDDKYSATTGKHITGAVAAVPNKQNIIRAPFFHRSLGMTGFTGTEICIRKCVDIYETRINNALFDQCKAIKNTFGFYEARALHIKYVTLCNLCGMEPKPIEEFKNYEQARERHARNVVKNETAQREAEERMKRQHEERLLAERENLPKWLRGEIHGLFHCIPVHLRLINDGTEIQTTKGATVPVSHAVRLWNAIKKGVDIRGYRIGSFMAVSNDGQTIRIGCHDIQMSIAEEFMSQFATVEA